MTIRKMYEKYKNIAETHELVTISEVINDLYHIISEMDLRNHNRRRR